jgi:hypothetical protein
MKNGRNVSWPCLLAALLVCPPAGAAPVQQPSPAQIKAVRQSCHSDYMSHCVGVPPRGIAALRCLQQHDEDLSSACRQAMVGIPTAK